MFLDKLYSLIPIKEMKSEIWIMVFPLFQYIVHDLRLVFVSKENPFWDHFNNSINTYMKTL